jgi:DNA-binding NarL/FixJ family response regulator
MNQGKHKSLEYQTGPPHLIRRRYRLSEWLGRGRFGVVYIAQDEALDRPVVIKFLEREGTGSSERSARFLREARMVAHLSHPNIMSIYDMGQEQGWEYLVLEYVPGGDLRGLLQQRQGPVPPAEAIPIASGILQALSYAHEQGIFHGDIKPENILITPAGQVKVADFGLAWEEAGVRLAQDGAIAGTLAYLAPECLHGAGRGLLADQYSLGVVLYELLTGRLPFEGGNPAALLSKITYGAFEPPRTLKPEISPALEQFLLRLLAADPGQRFPNSGEALAALMEIRTSGSLPQDPGDAYRPGGMGSHLAAALEADHRQMAGQIQSSIVDPLKLLLAQAVAFEQTLPGQPATRMAVSVLASLARQVLQQANDLEATLRPVVLETLGLEPALEALADRYERAYSLRLTLDMARLPQRPRPAVELALYRSIQDVLEILRGQRFTLAALELWQEEALLRLEMSFPAGAFLPEGALAALRQRIEPLSGQLAFGRTSQDQAHLAIHIPLRSEMHFTPRERQILEGLVLGLSNKEIAGQLSISPRTINYHLDNIFSKLGVHTRTEAAVIALRQGWARRPSQANEPTEDPG